MRIRRAAAISLATVGAVMAIGAGSAIAEEGPITFSPEDKGMKWSGSITIEKDGGDAKTCTFQSTGGYPYLPEGYFMLGWSSFGEVVLSCSGNTKLRWRPEGNGFFYDQYVLEFMDGLNGLGEHESPYGPWGGDPVIVPFVNGSGGTASSITFDDTLIGHTYPGYNEITATGTVSVTTNSGGLLTMSK